MFRWCALSKAACKSIEATMTKLRQAKCRYGSFGRWWPCQALACWMYAGPHHRPCRRINDSLLSFLHYPELASKRLLWYDRNLPWTGLSITLDIYFSSAKMLTRCSVTQAACYLEINLEGPWCSLLVSFNIFKNIEPKVLQLLIAVEWRLSTLFTSCMRWEHIEK